MRPEELGFFWVIITVCYGLKKGDRCVTFDSDSSLLHVSSSFRSSLVAGLRRTRTEEEEEEEEEARSKV